MIRVDALAPVAGITRRLPRRAAETIGWHVGEWASRRERIATLRNGGRVAVDVGDYVHRPMYFMGEYELGTTRLVQRRAKSGWTVLDIGANVGYFAVVAARAGGPGSRVVAFEPNPAIGKMLARTAHLNPELEIRAEHMAVGDSLGELHLHTSSVSRNSGLSTLREDLPNTTGQTVSVKVTTIDAYCDENGLAPDMIKIDVEGFEHRVLIGAERTLDNVRPGTVICEVVPERDDPAPIISLMERHGYYPYAITDQGDVMPVEVPADDSARRSLAPATPDPSFFCNVCFEAS